MINSDKEGFVQLLKIAIPYLLVTTIYTSLVIGLEELLGDHIYNISGQIASVFGLAVAFFLGFRMNSAYDRWWEARKIFGELTNNSRSFTAKVYAYHTNEVNFHLSAKKNLPELAERLILLNVLYIKQLKNEMHNNFHLVFDKYEQALIETF